MKLKKQRNQATYATRPSFDRLMIKKIAVGKAAREIKRVEHELEREDKLMGGREMLRIIYDCFDQLV